MLHAGCISIDCFCVATGKLGWMAKGGEAGGGGGGVASWVALKTAAAEISLQKSFD